MDTLSPGPQDGNIPLKRCTGPCARMLPATNDYFSKHSQGKLNPRCKQCRSEQNKAYRLEHQDEYRQKQVASYKEHQDEYRRRNAESYARHREDRRRYAAQYRAEHPEQVKTYRETHRDQHKQYDVSRYWENKEQELARTAKYRQEHADELREKRRQYYQSPQGILAKRTHAHNRRALKRNASGRHTKEELFQQLERQKHRCYYCHVKLAMGRNSWNADHIVPLIRGGSNDIGNIVISCPSCNVRKQKRLPHEWTDGGRLL